MLALKGVYHDVRYEITPTGNTELEGSGTGDLYVLKDHLLIGQGQTWYKMPLAKLKGTKYTGSEDATLAFDKFTIALHSPKQSLTMLRYFLETYKGQGTRRDEPLMELLRFWALGVRDTMRLSSMLDSLPAEVELLVKTAREKGLIMGDVVSGYGLSLFSDDDLKNIAEAGQQPICTHAHVMEMEYKIQVAIEHSRIPWSETRKFLKAQDASAAADTDIYRYLNRLFELMAIGTLTMFKAQPFHYTFHVDDSPFPHLPGKHTGKRCYLTVEFFAQFFNEDLDIACSVKETKCTGAGDEHCEFEIALQPIDTYAVLMGPTDIQALKMVAKSGNVGPELKAQVEILRTYGLVDELNLTEIGRSMLLYLGYTWGGGRKVERVVEPPWNQPIAELITAPMPQDKLSTELLGEIPETELPWMKDSKVVDLTTQDDDEA